MLDCFFSKKEEVVLVEEEFVVMERGHGKRAKVIYLKGTEEERKEKLKEWKLKGWNPRLIMKGRPYFGGGWL